MAAPAANTPWSTGLLDCAEDKESCCLTFWCPCITMGRVAEIVDRGSTTSGSAAALYTLIAVLTGCECQWIYSCVYRTKLRAQYGLQETPCPDICVHLCLEGLALCQEYRELRNRGFVMDIGWHANMERQQQGHGGATATAPPATQQMI